VIVIDNPYERWPAARTALMSAADVLLHLSTGIEESASLVILEAMAHGLPVIASRWSGAVETVREEEGILIDVWSAPLPDALRDGMFGRNPLRASGEVSRHAACDARQTIAAVVGFATNAERRQRAGEAALRGVRERHDLAGATRQRIDFFDEVAAGAEAAWTGPPPVRRLVDVARVLHTLGGH
jgi:glycosyltransferase involved in cell wall biosynthesis